MIVSGEQQRDTAVHTLVSILLQTPLPFRLPHNIEQSSLCYSVGPCWLSILNTVYVHVDFKLPNYPFPQFSPYPVEQIISKVVLFLSLSHIYCYCFLIPFYNYLFIYIWLHWVFIAVCGLSPGPTRTVTFKRV